LISSYREEELYAWLKKQSKNPAVGVWRLNQPSVGESTLQFKNFEPGEPREIEGRKVRVVEGVTIERIAPNGS
jgi:hypothetical protein